MSSRSSGKPSATPRSLAKLLAGTDALVWVLDAAQRIAWISDAAAVWLGVQSTDILGRQAIAGSTSDDPLDQVAAVVAAPVGLESVGLLTVSCVSPRGETQAMRFLCVGQGSQRVVIATSGLAIATSAPQDVCDANQYRSVIHQWRKRDATWGGIAAAGSSKAARRLRGQIQLATQTHHDLALVGPKGCGAERIARRIHAASHLSEAAHALIPLVVVDGPLMDAELLEASLSPAMAFLQSEAAGEDARHCTVLVRELDETPLDVQQRLEGFIAEHGARVRLIGLMQSGIDEVLQANRLTVDLASRLEVLTIRIEPLAARVGDVALMASALVDAWSANGTGKADRLSRAALDRLLIYPWPDNFEELDAAIRSAMLVCSGPAIGVEHLPLAIRSYQPGEPIDRDEPIVTDLDRAMEQFELKQIRAALKAAHGNRSEAARMLGISRARLLRRLDEPEASP